MQRLVFCERQQAELMYCWTRICQTWALLVDALENWMLLVDYAFEIWIQRARRDLAFCFFLLSSS